MLERDYILAAIDEFVAGIGDALVRACLDRDLKATHEAEHCVAELLDLDERTALSLSPDSLVTMMLLSGIADSTAAYVAYALLRIGDAYAAQDRPMKASLRRKQAVAVAESFDVSLGTVPEELQETNQRIVDGLTEKARTEAEAAAEAAKAERAAQQGTEAAAGEAASDAAQAAPEAPEEPGSPS